MSVRGRAESGLPSLEQWDQSEVNEELNPEEFGLDVTVCIAARSLLDPCVVGVSDMMLSFSDDSIAATDNLAIKHLHLGDCWQALYAGLPTHALSIVDRAADVLRKGGPRTSRKAVQSAVQEAYRAEVRQEIYDRFLSRWKVMPEQFRRSGRKQFGDAEFTAINTDIRTFSLGTSLLIVGFDGGFSHIFSVNQPNGHVIDHTQNGHWAVGSGARMAMSALAGRFTDLALPELVYRLCEAKFCAETARGVGLSTLVFIMRRNGYVETMWGRETEKLKAIWKRERKRSAPKAAIDAVKDAIRHSGVESNPDP